MSKLLDKVIRLEGRLDDRNRAQAIEMNVMRLEEKINALANYLNIEFKTASAVAVKKEVK